MLSSPPLRRRAGRFRGSRALTGTSAPPAPRGGWRGHPGHAGSVDALKDHLGDEVEVLMPERDARILAGEEVVEDRRGSWPKIKTRPDVLLLPGHRIASLEVVASPGHTPGHVAFLDTRDTTLLAGDVYTTLGGAAVTSHFKLKFPLAAMGTWNKAMDLE